MSVDPKEKASGLAEAAEVINLRLNDQTPVTQRSPPGDPS